MSAALVGLDGEQAIRDALAAGPTPGPWIAEINSIGTHVLSAAAAAVYPRNIADLIIPFWAATDPDDQHGVRTRVQADTRYIAACHPETMRALLAELDRLRSASRQEEEPMDLALCESQKLVLRIGRTYRFTPVAGCKTCDAMAAQANDAYGSIPAAPHQAQEAQGDRHGD